MVGRCVNHYGIKFGVTNRECREVFKYFVNCIERNSVFGKLKRVNPEYFATS